MHDINSRVDIERLVDKFYEEARKNTYLGPIFEEKIGKLWFLHLDTMYRFWSTLLLGEQSYFGKPFPKHLPLILEDKHFDEWLSLFNRTIDGLFKGNKAEEAKQKATNILNSFRNRYHKKLGDVPENWGETAHIYSD